MPFIPVPDTCFVRFHMKTGTAELPATNGLYFYRPEFTVEELEILLNNLESGFCADLMAHLDTNYTMWLAEAYDMNSVDAPKVTLALDIDGGSSLENTPLSPATTLVVTFSGNLRGKWWRGRNYVAGISEQNADQVDVGQTLADQILLAYTNLISDPPPGWVWVVCSKTFNKVPRAVGVVQPVTSAVVRSRRFAFQRRRAERP
jgi:hypothetical protein